MGRQPERSDASYPWWVWALAIGAGLLLGFANPIWDAMPWAVK
jgi:hypothetical protein